MHLLEFLRQKLLVVSQKNYVRSVGFERAPCLDHRIAQDDVRIRIERAECLSTFLERKSWQMALDCFDYLLVRRRYDEFFAAPLRLGEEVFVTRMESIKNTENHAGAIEGCFSCHRSQYCLREERIGSVTYREPSCAPASDHVPYEMKGQR